MKLAKALVFLPLALLFLTPVHATQSVTLTGNVTAINSSIRVLSDIDSNGTTYATIVFLENVTGGIQGVGNVTENIAINDTTGSFASSSTGLFTGTILGRTGTADFRGTNTGQFDFVRMTVVSSQGHSMFTHGSGGLAGIHGQGTTSSNTNSVSYSIQVHFGPT